MNRSLRDAIKKIPGATATAKAIWPLYRKFRRKQPNKPKKPKNSHDIAQFLKVKIIDQETAYKVGVAAADAFAIWATLEYRRGNLTDALSIASSIPPHGEISAEILKEAWPHLRDLGRYDLALKALALKAKSAGETDSVLARINHTIFARSAYEAYARYAGLHDPADSKGYVVLFDLGQRVTTGLMVPLTHALLKKGYAVCSSVAGVMPLSPRPELQGISSMFRGDGSGLTDEPWTATELHNEWTLDWEAGEVSCDGVNYFPFFLERISKLGKRYRAGIDTPEAERLFNNMLRRSDLALVLCKRLLAVAALGKPIRIASMETHFAPWGVVRRWCEQVGRNHNIHLVSLSSAYENYFSNLTSLESRTLSVEDMTARPNLRHPFLGGAERFEKFLETHTHDTSLALQWVKMDRSRTATAIKGQRDEVLRQIAEAKKAGRKVYAAFGKVLIDFAAPDDQGHVFSDFPEWIRFLVRSAEKTGALLIIKPHPHEIRPEIAMEGVETMRDLLPEQLPSNLIFLEHASFNSYELAEVADLSFVWNGTIYCEFPVLGRAVVAESVWAERDYPVRAHIVRTEAEYLGIMNGQIAVPLTTETQKRASAYLQFMRSEEVSIPFHYVRRAGTNKPIGANLLYTDQLVTLEQNGDRHVDFAAERFFEFAGAGATNNHARDSTVESNTALSKKAS